MEIETNEIWKDINFKMRVIYMHVYNICII